MTDGGFSITGQENIQEIQSKQLYLCQCVVRTGGHFVCKLFDTFTPFTAGLLYLMRRSFKKFTTIIRECWLHQLLPKILPFHTDKWTYIKVASFPKRQDRFFQERTV